MQKKLYCSQLWIYNGENVQEETCGVEVCCREKLDELAMYLYEKETITGDEFMDILDRK